MPFTETLLIRLALAALIGGIIGAEREYRNKSAGLRTMILICMGSSLFTVLSVLIGTDSSDRIASNIVTGVGFLGGGVIFKTGSTINGITTAATVWMTAALGMAVGAGYYIGSAVACVMVFAVLYVFTVVENWIERVNQIRSYRIVCDYNPENLYAYEDVMKNHRLKPKRVKQQRVGKEITGNWMVKGSRNNHRHFVETILKDNTVKEFDF